jgi:GNAT superfamily N-acetyltransferase
VDDATLARLEHENMIETMLGGARAAPGHVERRDGGVVMFATGLPVGLFNQVVVEDATAGVASVAAAIAAAVATMRERGETYVVNLRRGTDDAWRPLMADLGLGLPAEAAPLPGMALHPIPAPGAPSADPSRPDDHEIRLVTDQAGMEDHLRTGAVGFGMPEAMLRAFVAADLWRQPGRAVYVGYAAGEPVSTGLGVRTGNTVGVYNIATIERARRRGYGAAMTVRVAADGAAVGCDVAILQSSEMGRPVYERLGYRTVVEYDGYAEAGTDAAH